MTSDVYTPYGHATAVNLHSSLFRISTRSNWGITTGSLRLFIHPMPRSRISRESPQYESIVFRENPLMVGRLCTPHSLRTHVRTRERRPQEAVTSARHPGIIEQPIDAWWEPKNDEKIYNRTMWSGSYKRGLCRFFFRFRTKRRNLYRRRWSSERRRFVVSKGLRVPLI